MFKGKVSLWIYEAVLVIAFLRGLFMFGEPDMPRLALCVGLVINLLLQYVMIKAIRRTPIHELPIAEQAAVKTRLKALMKIVYIGAAALAAVMLMNVGLFIKHIYSGRTFASIQLVAMAIFFYYFFVSFRRLQKRQG